MNAQLQICDEPTALVTKSKNNIKEKQRLLDVVRAGYESTNIHEFTMRKVYNRRKNNAPSCILGIYASRRDLQQVLQIPHYKSHDSISESILYIGVWGATTNKIGWSSFIQDYFGLNDIQAHKLFGPYGCNNARTPQQAARYIENFIKTNFP